MDRCDHPYLQRETAMAKDDLCPLCLETELRVERLKYSIERLGLMRWNKELKDAIEEALEWIAGYEDVVDSDYGTQAPNKAMLIGNSLRAAIGERPGV